MSYEFITSTTKSASPAGPLQKKKNKTKQTIGMRVTVRRRWNAAPYKDCRIPYPRNRLPAVRHLNAAPAQPDGIGRSRTHNIIIDGSAHYELRATRLQKSCSREVLRNSPKAQKDKIWRWAFPTRHSAPHVVHNRRVTPLRNRRHMQPAWAWKRYQPADAFVPPSAIEPQLR